MGVKLAVVGSTGEVGRMIIKILEEKSVRPESGFLRVGENCRVETDLRREGIRVKELTAKPW
ncbi:hypothetical protein MASR2M17_17300 [Aminivibrio sp.]